MERTRTDYEGLAKRVERLEGGISDVTRRMDLIQQADDFLGKAQQVRDKYLDERFNSIEKKIDGFMSTTVAQQEEERRSNKTFLRSIALIAITTAVSVGVAVVTFFVKGGFNGAG